MRLLWRPVLFFLPSANAWQYFFAPPTEPSCTRSCFTTVVDAYQTTRAPIWFSTHSTDSFSLPKLSAVNGSAWEQWYFDAVSADPSEPAAIALSLARDPSYRTMGLGVLRVELVVSLGNGTRLGGADFVASSRVTECCGAVRGEWTSADGSRSYVFDIAADLRSATVRVDSPVARGSFHITSTTAPRLADGSLWPPSLNASHEVSPLFHFTETIPAGSARIDLTLPGSDSELRFVGLGGHNRLWGARDWFSIVREWHGIRGAAGPFAFSLFEDVSAVDGGRYQATVLFEDGEKVFASTHRGSGRNETREDHHIITRRFGGKVDSGIGDVATGWTLEFVSPARGRRWVFELDHLSVVFRMALGEGKGLAAFAEKVRGGEVGLKQFEGGCGIGEQVFLPKSMSVGLMMSLWLELVRGSNMGIVKGTWLMMTSMFR